MGFQHPAISIQHPAPSFRFPVVSSQFRVACFVVLCIILLAGCVNQQNIQNNSNISEIQTANFSMNETMLVNSSNSSLANNQTSYTSYAFNATNQKGKLIVYYFYSSVSCPNCPNSTKQIDSLERIYSPFIEVQRFDVQKPDEGAVFWDLVERINLTKCLCKVPFVYVNGTRLIGPYEINDSLEEIISNFSQTAEYDFSPVRNVDGKLIVYFFYSPNCPSCKAILSDVERIAKHYWNETDWRDFDLTVSKKKEQYFQFYKQYNLTWNRSGTPMILVNGTVLWGRYEINDSLERMITETIR